jgi:hypothetical protein
MWQCIWNRMSFFGYHFGLPFFATVISNARKLVSIFNTSYSVPRLRLISLSRRKLLSDVSTIMSSIFFSSWFVYINYALVSHVCQEIGLGWAILFRLDCDDLRYCYNVLPVGYLTAFHPPLDITLCLIVTVVTRLRPSTHPLLRPLHTWHVSNTFSSFIDV